MNKVPWILAVCLLTAQVGAQKLPAPIDLDDRSSTQESLASESRHSDSPREFSYFTTRLLESKAKTSRLTKEERELLKKARENVDWYDARQSERDSMSSTESDLSPTSGSPKRKCRVPLSELKVKLFALGDSFLPIEKKGWFAKRNNLKKIRNLLRNHPLLFTARFGATGHTFLHYAAATENAALVKILVTEFLATKDSSGFDPNDVDKSGNTPLHYVAKHLAAEPTELEIRGGKTDGEIENLLNIAELLITHGGDVLSKNTSGETARNIVASVHDRSLLKKWDVLEKMSGGSSAVFED